MVFIQWLMAFASLRPRSTNPSATNSHPLTSQAHFASSLGRRRPTTAASHANQARRGSQARQKPEKRPRIQRNQPKPPKKQKNPKSPKSPKSPKNPKNPKKPKKPKFPPTLSEEGIIFRPVPPPGTQVLYKKHCFPEQREHFARHIREPKL